MQECFHLVDTEGKGYITAEDMQRLWNEQQQVRHQHEDGDSYSKRSRAGSEATTKSLSSEQAKRMVSFCSSDGRVDRQDFNRLMSPP